MSTPMSAAGKKIILLRPRGFCAGVVRAIDVVKIALNMYGAPIYVRKDIGHKDHDEVIGTLGEAPEATALVSTVEDVDRLEVVDPERVSFITQTTLSLDETRDIVVRLKEKFPKIQGPAAQDICYATENRQV